MHSYKSTNTCKLQMRHLDYNKMNKHIALTTNSKIALKITYFKPRAPRCVQG